MPTGELPRNILMTVDRSMVGTIAPGTRITAVAIYSTVQVLSRLGHPTLLKRAHGLQGRSRTVALIMSKLHTASRLLTKHSPPGRSVKGETHCSPHA